MIGEQAMENTLLREIFARLEQSRLLARGKSKQHASCLPSTGKTAGCP
jgi:hypothetical protein